MRLVQTDGGYFTSVAHTGTHRPLMAYRRSRSNEIENSSFNTIDTCNISVIESALFYSAVVVFRMLKMCCNNNNNNIIMKLCSCCSPVSYFLLLLRLLFVKQNNKVHRDAIHHQFVSSCSTAEHSTARLSPSRLSRIFV